MEVQVDAMLINQGTKKRKGLFSVSSPRASRVPTCGSFRTPVTTAQAPSNAPGTVSSSEGVNLSLALTALKVSLKRDLESFAPPTPAVSPAHGRGTNKRARFDYASFDDDADVAVAKPLTTSPLKTSNALLAVSSCIKSELENCRRAIERARKPCRRKQLNYYAIIGAFHRAAHERKVAVQVDCIVEASTD
ncbi:uncharacterized protein PHALS_01130 [Plasmopara halstedii]|uniref:Uncharacterized protein n=1 Tax=Plasmopara halstedii TaxID=4781 RepID=A0A0P1AU42_PLAHL|nr:uncharacterized protein PHALS_01130 [Plasmopara halstedii]CEG44793.1 hypothetical protein PHALS_01130 [Plasmopara halstedii]|eukprot:XP_024581162.1 hypothetical protein PHALS_01130 [Plasmopara halstedii]